MNNRKRVQKYSIIFYMAIIIASVFTTCGNPNTTNIIPTENIERVPARIIREATLTIHPSIPVANIQIPDREYVRFFHTFSRFIPDITQFLYNYFADDFDFIMLSHNEDSRFPGVTFLGRYHPVKNDTMGIGQELFDNTTQFGSAGRLQGVIQFPFRAGLTNGPGLHEIIHRWGNYVLSAEPHWGFSSAGGQLGGFDLDSLTRIEGNRYSASVGESNNFADFANDGNSVPYSPIELYLAGLVPASEVPDIHVATNPRWVRFLSEFTADEFEVYSIERIIGEHGARVPNVQNSQKHFRVLFVVLSSRDLTEEEWTALDRMTSEFSFAGVDVNPSYNFWEATGGRATIQFSGIAESVIQEPNISAPDSDSLAPMIDSPIVGTWNFNDASTNPTLTYIFEENGVYSNWGSSASHPSDIIYTGTYSIASDSVLRQCIENLSGNAINPPACNNRSYSIVNQTLTLGAAEFDIGERISIHSQQTYMRQPPQSIVGSWEGINPVTRLRFVTTFSENGNYLNTIADDPSPLDVGTYRSISDSMLEICLNRAHGVTLDSQVCFDSPYRFVHNTLILEPVRIVFSAGPTYVPELRFTRQTE